MSQLLPDPDLDANFARDIVRLQAEVARYGGHLRIRSGYRSRAEQAAIYARKTAAGADRTTVAPPGHSMHERGQAVDFAGSGKSLALAAKLAPQFNIVQAPWKGGPQQDPVHFEPIGARGQRPMPMPEPPPMMAEPATAPGPILPPGSLVPRPAEPMPAPRFTLEGGPHDPQAMALFQAAVLGSRRS